MACDPALFILDEGDSITDGTSSSYVVRWQTIGYASNSARRSAIKAHPDYLSFVTTDDGRQLKRLKWTYENQVGDKKIVEIEYRWEQESDEHPLLQDIGDETYQISFGSRAQPLFYGLGNTIHETGTKFADAVEDLKAGNFVNYDPYTQEHKGITREQTVTHYNVTKVYPADFAGDPANEGAWLKEREDKMWTINNSTWLEREARTVIFAGMVMQQQWTIKEDGEVLEGPWHISYAFRAVRPEVIDLRWYGLTTSPDPDLKTLYPWDYNWVYYRTKESDGGVQVPKAEALIQSKIYSESDFSTIIAPIP